MRDENGFDGSNGRHMATMTHARLRAGQGDIRGARALLLDILHRNPGHREAMALLAQITGRKDDDRAKTTSEPLAEPQAGEPARMSADFKRILSRGDRPRRARIERLEQLLRRITGG